MKISVLLFILITPLSIFMQAQEISLAEARAYAEQLVTREILNEQGKAALLKILVSKKGKVEDAVGENGHYDMPVLSKETILWFCREYFYEAQLHRMVYQSGIEEKITPEDTFISRGWSSYPPIDTSKLKDLIHPKRSTFGVTRSRTLEDLKALGLINERVYGEARKKILDAAIVDEGDLTGFLFKRNYYYSTYDAELKKQQQHIQQLTDKGILTIAKKDELLQSYKPYELKGLPEILSYSGRYSYVDLSQLEADPPITYPVIFQAIGKLVPGFAYEHLTIEIKEQQDGTLIQQDLTISFTVKGKVYSHTFLHDLINMDTTIPKSEPSRAGFDFHAGVNKWLTDVASPYRLYRVKFPDTRSGVPDSQRLGLLLLKAGEDKIVDKYWFDISRETFGKKAAGPRKAK